jgi:hypothetical protein
MTVFTIRISYDDELMYEREEMERGGEGKRFSCILGHLMRR